MDPVSCPRWGPLHLELSHEILIKDLVQREAWEKGSVRPHSAYPPGSHTHTEGWEAGHWGTLCPHRKGKGFFWN